MIRRTIRMAAVAVALVAAITPVSTALAGESEHHPPHLRCLDVVHGEGTLSLQGLTLVGSSYGDTVTFRIDLAAPSCTNGTYHVAVTDNDTARSPLASLTRQGDGTTTLDFRTSVPADADGCVLVQVRTTDSRGRTIDSAPDDGGGGTIGEGCGAGGSVWR